MNSETDLDLSWYAVHVKSRHEFRVLERLTKAGIDAFLPVVQRLSDWSDRKKLVTFPLFPGYLFTHIDENPVKRLTVLKIEGVVRFLGMVPGQPEPVPEEQVLSLKRLVESKESIDPYPYLKEGQRVRIRRGPLTGLEGLLVERRGQHLLVLSVDILQQSAAVKITALEVEPA